MQAFQAPWNAMERFCTYFAIPTMLMIVLQCVWLKLCLIFIWLECHLRLLHAICITIADQYDLETTGGFYNRGTALWIGANDEAREGSFQWLPSGNPVVFVDWDGRQPNNAAGGQDCVAYYHGRKKWHDIRCIVSLEKFICEGWSCDLCDKLIGKSFVSRWTKFYYWAKSRLCLWWHWRWY